MFLFEKISIQFWQSDFHCPHIRAKSQHIIRGEDDMTWAGAQASDKIDKIDFIVQSRGECDLTGNPIRSTTCRHPHMDLHKSPPDSDLFLCTASVVQKNVNIMDWLVTQPRTCGGYEPPFADVFATRHNYIRSISYRQGKTTRIAEMQ